MLVGAGARNCSLTDPAMRGPNGQGPLCHWGKETVALGPTSPDHLILIQTFTYTTLQMTSPGRGPMWCFVRGEGRIWSYATEWASGCKLKLTWSSRSNRALAAAEAARLWCQSVDATSTWLMPWTEHHTLKMSISAVTTGRTALCFCAPRSTFSPDVHCTQTTRM